MATRTEKIVDTLRTHIDNSDHEGLVTAAEALIAQYERQVRQINRMVKLSDATAENLMATNQRLSALTENLSRFVPKTVVDRLMDPQERQIGYRDRRELTVFFSDIVGFTAMTEQLEPEQLSTLLGDYFSEMGRLCEKWGGTLDQFIGDAVVIFFGAPESRGSSMSSLTIFFSITPAIIKKIRSRNIIFTKGNKPSSSYSLFFLVINFIFL